DLCNRLHESEVRSQYVCDPLDFVDRRPGRDALESVENGIRWFGLGGYFRISVICQVREILLWFVQLGVRHRTGASSVLQTRFLPGMGQPAGLQTSSGRVSRGRVNLLHPRLVFGSQRLLWFLIEGMLFRLPGRSQCPGWQRRLTE